MSASRTRARSPRQTSEHSFPTIEPRHVQTIKDLIVEFEATRAETERLIREVNHQLARERTIRPERRHLPRRKPES